MSSELTNREILNISIGDQPLGNLGRNITGTFLDKLPKDIIQYLQRYTGPQDCFYSSAIVWSNGHLSTRHHRYRAWVNKTEKEAQRHSQKNNYGDGWRGPNVEKGKLIFIDGKPHVAVPVYKNYVYGMDRRKRIKTIKSKQCGGTTTQRKRCKHRIIPLPKWDKSQKLYCHIHKKHGINP